MRAAKVDGNHDEIRDGLRALGVYVIDTHGLGQGFADLVAYSWYAGWQLLEVKMPRGRLTSAERKLQNECPGPIWVIRTLEQACEVMGVEVEGVEEKDAN